jgi:hypothetical protein
LRYLDRIPAQLSIPEIVIDEVINKYREDMYQLNNDIQKLNKDYRRLSNVDSNLISIDIKKAIDEYRQFLDAFIYDNDIKLLPYPKVSHKDIVQRELLRKKPFKINGTGYRDCLIWETIKENFKVPQESIVFISKNKSDFGEEPTFFEELKSELTNAFRFELFNSIQSFNDKYIKPLEEHITKLTGTLSQNGLDFFDLHKWVCTNMETFIYDDGAGCYGIGFDEYGTVMLDSIDKINSIDILDAVEINEREIKLTVSIDADLVLYISASDYDCERSDFIREFFDYDIEPFINISTSQSHNLKMEYDLILDKEKRQVLSRELRTVEGEAGIVSFSY